MPGTTGGRLEELELPATGTPRLLPGSNATLAAPVAGAAEEGRLVGRPRVTVGTTESIRSTVAATPIGMGS